MQTGRLPGNRSGDMVLATADLPFEVTLKLAARTVGQLLTELSLLHSDQRCSCPAQHTSINMSDHAVQAFVSGPLNGKHKHIDLRKCAFWLASAQHGPDLSKQSAAEWLPAHQNFDIIARAGKHVISNPAKNYIAHVSTKAGHCKDIKRQDCCTITVDASKIHKQLTLRDCSHAECRSMQLAWTDPVLRAKSHQSHQWQIDTRLPLPFSQKSRSRRACGAWSLSIMLLISAARVTNLRFCYCAPLHR